MIKGIFSYEIFGQTVWITTTHVSLSIVFLLFVVFALIAHHVIVNADPYAKPSDANYMYLHRSSADMTNYYGEINAGAHPNRRPILP